MATLLQTLEGQYQTPGLAGGICKLIGLEFTHEYQRLGSIQHFLIGYSLIGSTGYVRNGIEVDTLTRLRLIATEYETNKQETDAFFIKQKTKLTKLETQQIITQEKFKKNQQLIEGAYKETMALSEARDYWDKKSISHSTEFENYKKEFDKWALKARMFNCSRGMISLGTT